MRWRLGLEVAEALDVLHELHVEQALVDHHVEPLEPALQEVGALGREHHARVTGDAGIGRLPA